MPKEVQTLEQTQKPGSAVAVTCRAIPSAVAAALPQATMGVIHHKLVGFNLAYHFPVVLCTRDLPPRTWTDHKLWAVCVCDLLETTATYRVPQPHKAGSAGFKPYHTQYSTKSTNLQIYTPGDNAAYSSRQLVVSPTTMQGLDYHTTAVGMRFKLESSCFGNH